MKPLAGKSTLNRLELGTEQPHGSKKIRYRAGAIDALLVRHPLLRRLKIGARISITVRNIGVLLASSFPGRGLLTQT